MGQKLETLDFVIQVLLEHEKTLDVVAARYEKLTDRLNWLIVALDLHVAPFQTQASHPQPKPAPSC